MKSFSAVLAASLLLLSLPAFGDDEDFSFSSFETADLNEYYLPGQSPQAMANSATGRQFPSIMSDEDADLSFAECLQSASADACQMRGEALSDVAMNGGCRYDSDVFAKADELTGDGSGGGGTTAGSAR